MEEGKKGNACLHCSVSQEPQRARNLDTHMFHEHSPVSHRSIRTLYGGYWLTNFTLGTPAENWDHKKLEMSWKWTWRRPHGEHKKAPPIFSSPFTFTQLCRSFHLCITHKVFLLHWLYSPLEINTSSNIQQENSNPRLLEWFTGRRSACCASRVLRQVKTSRTSHKLRHSPICVQQPCDIASRRSTGERRNLEVSKDQAITSTTS